MIVTLCLIFNANTTKMDEENICRLCLNLVKNKFEVINAVIRQMLEVVLLKLDLNATKNPIICQDCSEIIKKSYYFKLACIDTEELILSFWATKKSAKFHIKDVYEDSKGVKAVTNEDINICVFCMNQTINFVLIHVLIDYMQMLTVFMPKMVLNIIKDPVICTSCKEILECYFNLKKKILETEEKINKCIRKEKIDSTSQIRLSNVLGILFKAYADTEIPLIKQESLLEDVEQNTEIEMYDKQIKCEALEIKDEVISSGNTCNDKYKQEMYKCEICNYQTKYNRLKSHMLIHKDASEIEMHKCGKCTYETKYKKSLKNHMLSHMDISEVEMQKCSICTYQTRHKQYLKRHLLKHKDASEIEMCKCGICGYETIHKHHLKSHMLLHRDTSEVEMHKCEICTYETKYKKGLKTHMLIHMDVSEGEMQKCGLCTFETRYKQSLKRHLISHKDTSELEMYKCRVCSYETKYKHHLRSHMLIHKETLDVKIHKCSRCTYETKYKKWLKKHMLIHTTTSEPGIYRCGTCSFETKCKGSLKKHLLTHKDALEVEIYKCDKCTYETKYKRSFKSHMLTHKDITEETLQ